MKELCEKIEKQLLEKHEAMARRAAYGKVKYGATDEIREMAFLEYSEMLARRTKRMPEQAKEATNQALRNMLEKGKSSALDNGV